MRAIPRERRRFAPPDSVEEMARALLFNFILDNVEETWAFASFRGQPFS